MTIKNPSTITQKESDELVFLRDLLQFTPDVICTLDSTGHFLFVSAATTTLWGYSPEEMIGKHFSNFIVEEDRAATEAIAASVQIEGEVFDFENRYHCKNGTVTPMLWRACWDRQKRVIYAVGRDNAERKKITQQLAVQDRNLRRAYQVASLAWWEYSAAGEKFLFSDEMFLLLGLPVSESHELTFETYLSLVHPNDRSRIATIFCKESFGPLPLAPESVFHYQHRLLKPSGEMIIVSQTSECSRDTAGSITGFYGTAQDITESQYYHQLEKLEKDVLEMNSSSGRSLQEMLTVYLLGIEALHYGMYCSIMEARGEQLYNVAAPNLPEDYLETIDGISISDNIGSCGTAAFRKEKVIVTDILSDSRWESHRQHAERHNLLACWSLPILDTNGKVLATFGCYYKQNKAPSAREENTIQRTGNILKIIFESYHRQKALQESNQRYEMVTRATNDAIWDMDIERDETTWGEGFFTLFGHDYKTKHVGSDAVFSFVHPDDAGRVRDSINKALASGKTTWAEEFRFRKADGSYVYIIDKAVLIRDESGKPIRMVGAAQDISARKEAEEERKLSEEHYRLLFHKSPIPKLIFEPEKLQLVSANEAAVETYGYAIADLLNLTMLDLVAKEEQASLTKNLKLSSKGNHAATIFSRHRKKD
ncbi:MAG: PAS domain S-box protein, partial [Chitinophagaceae bacterium]